MTESTVDKFNIFVVMFLITLVIRLQMPVFTPYAASFDASSMLIGIILGVTSLTNLTGNLIAGPLVDRFGKKRFITFPLFIAGGLFIAHGLASNAGDLLILHALNGFALAFLIPAAFTLLSGYANNSRQQGKNMAINGMLSTLAGIIAPLIGGKMVVMFGYVNTYFFIGAAIIVIGFYSLRFIKDRQMVAVKTFTEDSKSRVLTTPNLLAAYLIGFAVMYIHGVLIFEIPYLTVEKEVSTIQTGQLFSLMSIGTFITLSLFFINQFDPFKRLMCGLFGMSLCLFGLFSALLPLPYLIFMMGMFFGLVMPAMATSITENAAKEVHGRAFGYMSAVFSVGIILSSSVTGIVRDFVSPYFIAFLIGMIVFTISGYMRLNSSQMIGRMIGSNSK
ncbi:MFS transporter [Salipaludibacillus aurantiacus]|uniref:Predicted arabinose efflux permease, MFS family n=1 Tax=Salipaludibacillus aurantiacus TaxID=1601833 RepID=A0A1H9VZB1_9BACI|nr:MFS transporter [Salipaludibacillus aurantiacus]SES26623.1 Predicted arabinose efflux permease, MFS family [Salipaludibacillus aurantiacus]